MIHAIWMPSETVSSGKPNLQDNSNDAKKAVQEKLDRFANKAAKPGEKRQGRYDAERGIFTK